MAVSARVPSSQVIGYVRKTVSYSDFETSGATISMGASIPKDAFVTDIIVNTTAAFDAGSTNVLLVGTSADEDSFVDADDINETVAATRAVTGLGLVTADTEPLIKYSWTGTVPTSGEATVVIAYAANL